MRTIQYKELLRKQAELSRVQDLGVKIIYKKNITKIVIGSCLAGLGVLTLPIPTGSMVLIPLGLSLVVSGGVDVMRYKNNLIRKAKVKLWGLFK